MDGLTEPKGGRHVQGPKVTGVEGQKFHGGEWPEKA